MKSKSSKPELKIIIGSKNYSSWSMRPWLVLEHSGLKYAELLIDLDQPETKSKISKYSPSGKVPALISGSVTIWDSLSICEYIAELVPEKNLWPTDSLQRALARSYVAEMHSGFTSLRSQLSMDIQLKIKMGHLLTSTIDDINRIKFLWLEALNKSGGPYLFGHFTIADAFFAPVVTRLVSYGILIKDPVIKKYVKTVLNDAAVKKWITAAHEEKIAITEL